MVTVADLAQPVRVKLGQLRRRQGFICRTLYATTVAMNEQGSIAKTMRQRRFMQHHDHRCPLRVGKLREQAQHGHLVIEVEMRQRLIKQVHAGRLHQQGSQRQTLARS